MAITASFFMINKASATKSVFKIPVSFKSKYFYNMTNKANAFNLYYQNFKSQHAHPIAQLGQIAGSSLLLLAIPASLLFHEILILVIGLLLELLLTCFALYIAQIKLISHFKKPLWLWKAKCYFLLAYLSGSRQS